MKNLPNRTPATPALLALPFGPKFRTISGLPSRRQIENFASKQALDP